MPANPVENISKPRSINSDYIPKEGMNTLLDLKTVEWDSFLDVRDRLITVGLYYDYCIRNGEGVGLDLSDVQFKKYLELFLRKEIQEKTQERKHPSCNITLRHYLAATPELMKRYLELRKTIRSTSNALLLSESGTRLGKSGCEHAVAKQCKKLGVTTFEGHVPAPHRLRHTFGTLNSGNRGIKLPVQQIQQRLRHSNIATTIEIYITNNPVLEEEDHDAFMSQRKLDEQPGNNHVPVVPVDYISETTTLELLHEHDLTTTALRKYAITNSVGYSEDGCYYYDSAWVQSLKANYVSQEVALNILKINRSSLWLWKRTHAVETFLIGTTCLVPRQPVMKKLHQQNRK